MAADNIFLQTSPTIDGEAFTPGYEDQIQLISFNHGGNHLACGGSKGLEMGEASFTKTADKATVDMLLALRDHTFYDVDIALTKQVGSVEQTYQLYEFTNAIFTSYSAAGAGNGDQAMEVWTLSYSSLDVSYTFFPQGLPPETETMTITPVVCVN